MANKRSLKSLIIALHKRVSLTIKMILVTVMVGVFVWVVVDQIQTHNLKSIFRAQFAERLSDQAMEDRLNFDRYVKVHHQSVRLFVAQKNFSDYIEKKKKDWSTEAPIQIKYYRRLPQWFPGLSVLRIFAKPRYALLLDSRGRVREVYHGRSRKGRLPPSLLQPTSLLLAKSRGQSFLTEINGASFLVAAESFFGFKGELLATLMLTSPIDEEFLNASLGRHQHEHIIALLTLGEKPQILTSSNLDELPAGTLLDTLKEHYLVTGEEFFDYGASELSIKLASFISMAEIESVTKSVLSLERKQRAIAAPVFILTFAFVMLWVTQRIQRLTQRISDFSQQTLGVQPQELQKGDQLYILEERFQRLTEDILEAREALSKEAEEKLILEKKSMEMDQKGEQLKLLQSVTEAVGVGVIKKTPDGLQAVNKQMEYFAQKCGGLSDFEMQDEDNLELSLLDKNGVNHIFYISSITFREEKILLIRDITEIKAQREALEHLALYDFLTGLPNRKLLCNRLRKAILAAQRERNSFALLMLDLDRFKEINDTLGHHIGDVVLKQVGVRLQSVLRKSDTIARFGGDEFAILLPVSDMEHAKYVSSRLLDVLKEPFTIKNNSLYINVSIGIALYPFHGEDLIQRADVAMYIAKQNQSGFSIYTPDQDHYNVHHLELTGELHRAIEHGDELALYYQPKLNYKTDSISSVEALVRWLHPQRGIILPNDFIPLAEQSGLIKPLTLWVLKTAIRQCADWHRARLKISVSVNLSARNLLDQQFQEEVTQLLKDGAVKPSWLELEIKESAIMVNPARAMEILKRLNTIGVRLSIDDFGTGYSSLAYLKKLPVNEIKIDKSFVINMAMDDDAAVIVHSTIELAHNLGLKVLAEGVESQEVFDMLAKLGCDVAQGNYICPPLPPAEFIRWLNKSSWHRGK